jgi:hypothetical protein
MNGQGTTVRRPRFVPSQLVSAGDLNAGQDYLVARLRHHNRTLHGCGTVCGLEAEVRVDDDGVQRLVVSPGTALDGAGNELTIPAEVSVRLTDLCWLTDEAGGRTVGTWPPDAQDPCGPSPGDQTHFLAICHREREEYLSPVAHTTCQADEVCEHLRLTGSYQLVLLDSIIEGEDCVSIGEPVEDIAWLGAYYGWSGDGLAPLPPSSPTVVTRHDTVLDVRWAGSPGDDVPTDNFQVEWTRRMYLGAGRYRFGTESDGAVVVEVDGQEVLNTWTIEPPAEAFGDIELVPGVHQVRVAYAHRSGEARLLLRWQLLEAGWHAEYRTFAGDDPPVFEDSSPLLTRIDPGLALDLAEGESPADDVPADHFVVRWERDLAISSPGRYEVEVETDDGMRVSIDGSMLIDEWQAQPRTRYRGLRMLAGGMHRIRVDFWQRRGRVRAKVRWRRVGPYNPAGCPPPLHPGCVVLAAVDVASGSIRSVENYVFDAERGHQRHVVPTVSTLATALAHADRSDAGPLLAQIVPSHGGAGSTTGAILVGHGVRGVTEVRFASGIVAEVLPGATDEWVPLRITVPAGVASGPRNFTVITPSCTYDSGDYGLTFDVDPPVATPTPTPTFSPTFSPTFFPSIFFPSTFIPATVAPTLAPSIFLPSDVVATIAPSLQPSIFVPSGFVATVGPGGGIGGRIVFGDVPLRDLDLDLDLADTLVAAGFEVGGDVLTIVPADLASRTGMTEVAAMAAIERVRDVLMTRGHVLDDIVSRPVDEAEGIIGRARAGTLRDAGVDTIGALAATPATDVAELLGMSRARADEIVAGAQELIDAESARRSTRVEALPGVGSVHADRLRSAGLATVAHIAVARADIIARAGDIGEEDAQAMIGAAREMLGVPR